MNDLHILYPISWHWKEVKYPKDIRSVIPHERYAHSMVAIPDSTKFLVFGGFKRYNESFKS